MSIETTDRDSLRGYEGDVYTPLDKRQAAGGATTQPPMSRGVLVYSRRGTGRTAIIAGSRRAVGGDDSSIPESDLEEVFRWSGDGTMTIQCLLPATAGSALETYDWISPSGGRTLLPNVKQPEPVGKLSSVIAPEVVGLGVAALASLAGTIYGFATGDTGLATVMAGPFLASLLGLGLLIFGVRRDRRR